MIFTLNLLTSVNLKSKIKKFIYSFIGRKGSFLPSGGEELFSIILKQQFFCSLHPSPAYEKKICFSP
mgnify:CR=1 FL=1